MESAYVAKPSYTSVPFAGEFINEIAISRLTGLHQSFIVKIFKGIKRPSAKSAYKIAVALGMKTERFLDLLAIHVEAHKLYPRALPYVVPFHIRDRVDKETKTQYNLPMVPESCVVNPAKIFTISLAGRVINMSAIARSRKIDLGLLSRIFNGKRQPSVKNARKIASALGMELEEFLDALDQRVKSLKS